MWNDRFSNASSHCLLCCFEISFLSSKDSRIAFCTCRINGFCDLVSVGELPSVTQIYSRCFKSNTSYEYSMLVRRHCVIVLKQNVLRVGEAEENRCFSSASPLCSQWLRFSLPIRIRSYSGSPLWFSFRMSELGHS
jgi:hypothetical protein